MGIRAYRRSQDPNQPQLSPREKQTPPETIAPTGRLGRIRPPDGIRSRRTAQDPTRESDPSGDQSLQEITGPQPTATQSTGESHTTGDKDPHRLPWVNQAPRRIRSRSTAQDPIRQSDPRGDQSFQKRPRPQPSRNRLENQIPRGDQTPQEIKVAIPLDNHTTREDQTHRRLGPPKKIKPQWEDQAGALQDQTTFPI